MQTQRKELNFKLQNTFDVFDILLNGWNIQILTDSLQHEKFNGSPKTVTLLDDFRSNFQKKGQQNAIPYTLTHNAESLLPIMLPLSRASRIYSRISTFF